MSRSSSAQSYDSAPPLEEEGLYSAGDRIADRYVLVRPLGVGGMGVVWVAHSEALQVNVAIKLLHRSLAGTEAVDRMQREARVTAQIGDRAMIRIFDFGYSDERPFIVMELLRGESLLETLERKRRVPPVRAVRTLLPIARALALAHDAGIVHRDVKPANIFISLDGGDRAQPKLLDFGVAKLDENSQARKLTARGTLLGSPAYMSPEQAVGLEVDPRSDVWSFCVTLYEAVTGDYPFVGELREEILQAIHEDQPIPLEDWGVDDEPLWHILEKGLRRRPQDRYQSMWDLGLVLAEYLFARGVEHDVTRTSLRGIWTRSLSDSQSVPPGERQTARPPGASRDEARGRVLSGQATTQIAPASQRWVLVLTAAVLLLAVALLVVVFSSHDRLAVESYSVTVPRPQIGTSEARPAAGRGRLVVPGARSPGAEPLGGPAPTRAAEADRRGGSAGPAHGERSGQNNHRAKRDFGF